MRKSSLILAVGLGVFFSHPASSETWYVDDSVPVSGDGKAWETAFKTIQEGIDASSDGDTVIVAPGTYVENIEFNGKNITLTGTDPLDPSVVAQTIIDPNRKGGSAVVFAGTETQGCVLSGLTIRNALEWGFGGGGICGGIWHQATHATIRNNAISGNIAYNDGGGLAYCDGVIEHNIVSDNQGCLGGGIYYCNGIIRDNIIINNFAFGPLIDDVYANRDDIQPDDPYPPPTRGAMGGGLYGCQGTIERNIVIRNRLGGSDSQGAGLCACHGTIRNNIIVGNAATWGYGGGLAGCSGPILNNTIITNWALRGGGLYHCGDMIRNCIIWGNLADHGAQLYESGEPIYSCIQGWTGGQGNIASDPSFIISARRDDNETPGWTYDDTLIEGDYHLRPYSPCIDAGDNSLLAPPGLDFDGNLRIAFGRVSLSVDMGAHEFNSAPLAVRLITRETGAVRLVWNSQPNDTYIVWSCTDACSRECIQEGTVASQGALTWWTDPDPTSVRKFYTVEMK